MSPAIVSLSRGERQRFDGPVRAFEVIEGSVELEQPDGTPSHAAGAGQTIRPGDKGGLTLRGLTAATVRVLSTSDAEVAERQTRETAERETTRAKQGEAAAPPSRAHMKPPLR